MNAMRVTRALTLFLFLALLGHSMGSAMVRREVAGTDNDVIETDVTGTDESTDTETVGAEGTGTTGDEGKGTGETGTEDEDKTTEEVEDDYDEDDDDDDNIPDQNDGSLYPDIGFQTGIVFGSPFVTLRQMQQYFFELESALHRVFEKTLKEAAVHPDSNGTSSEEVTVGGHKYLVNRTVLKGGDDDSSVVIKAITIVPTEERRKRALLNHL